MRKLTGAALAAGVIFFSGCNGLLQPTPTVENNDTAQNLVIPHGDNVKKAVAILIHKVKNLETAYANSSKQPSKEPIEPLKKAAEQKPQETQELLKKIESLEERVSQLSANAKQKEACPPSQNINTTVKSTPSKYDAVIKDFAYEGDLK